MLPWTVVTLNTLVCRSGGEADFIFVPITLGSDQKTDEWHEKTLRPLYEFLVDSYKQAVSISSDHGSSKLHDTNFTEWSKGEIERGIARGLWALDVDKGLFGAMGGVVEVSSQKDIERESKGFLEMMKTPSLITS